jgi:sphingomyelin phosphodiesterase 2
LYLQPEIEGMTSETPANSYTASESLRACPNGKRIDFVMCSSRKGLQIETIDVNIPLPPRIPNYPFSYSDHEAVCAKLRILESQSVSANQKWSKDTSISSLKEALQVCDAALRNIANDRRNYWLAFGIFVVLLAALPFTYDGSRIVHYTLTVTHLLLTLVAVFCLIMATVWNRIERHGILAGRLAIVTRIQALEDS